MNLGDLITALEAADPAQPVAHGFGHPHSYRGDYMELAFEPVDDTTVGDMLAAARSAVYATFQGYKGGEFVMTGDTWCWLSEEGCASGESISPQMLAWMLAAPAVSSLLPDQTLRDRIASALYEARRPGLGGMSESAAVTYMANAVVRVLPPPADQAAVLLEAAKSLERAFGVTQVTVELRLMSAKAQQPDTETVPCVRSDAHPPHLHSGLRKGVAVHGRCPGAPAVPVQPAAADTSKEAQS